MGKDDDALKKISEDIIAESNIEKSENNVVILETILTFIVDECDVNIEEIKSGSHLRNELNFNSLDGVHLIHEIEREYEHYIPDDVVYDLNITLKEFFIKIIYYIK
jgi:acyl carrier protein